jgi:hypothetical protein
VFIDSRNFDKEMLLDADVCIIGTGPAGITIANYLSSLKISVTILESGGIDGETYNQELNQGNIVGQDPGYDLEMSRLRLFGGASNHWVGSNQMLDSWDFKYKDWIKYSGWPINLEDIRPYYKKAFEINEIPNLIDDLPYFDKQNNFLKFKLLLEKKLKEDIDLITNYINPLRFSNKYEKVFKNSENIKTILHCTAKKITTDGNNIKNIEAETIQKKKVIIKAKYYVLAMGGIENARFLLLNLNNIPYNTLNNNPIIGSFFQEHYGFTAGTLLLHDEMAKYLRYKHNINFNNNLETESYFIPSEKTQYNQEMLNCRITFYEKDWNSLLSVDTIKNKSSYKDIYYSLTNLLNSMEGPIEWTKKIKKKDIILNKPQRVYLGMEQSPNPSSRVFLGNELDKLGQRKASLDWSINETDELSIRKTVTWLSQIVGVHGIGRLQIGEDLQNINWKSKNSPIGGGYHHMGTTRMGSNVNESVVNQDCKYHQLNNLYIAGSSVFPTSGSTNPTLTIVALALRLAETLKNKMS